MARAIATAWHGTYLLDGREVVRELRAPREAAELAARAARRAAGLLTREEEELLSARGRETWQTRDRRLVGEGVVYDARAPSAPEPAEATGSHREALFLRAEAALLESWDPSIHVEEAVRALRDLDRASNLLGERVASWASRDHPGIEGGTAAEAVAALLESPGAPAFAPTDPTVVEARRRLAALLRELAATRQAVDDAVRGAVPLRAPNLHRLLGPELAARLVAQAGGLDRLAHLPASTVQVLGAERAFFEHLRGKAPPPRHGLLFLHPAIQTAPRAQRGRLARALAAKVAIAARMDRAGAPVTAALSDAFERRRGAIRSAGPGRGGGRKGRRSRPPLHRATGDR